MAKQHRSAQPNANLLKHLERLGAKRLALETALMVPECLEKIVSSEPFNIPALKSWFDSLMQFDGANQADRMQLSTSDYDLIKVVLSQLMTKIFKARGSKPTESIKNDFLAIENWIYEYHIACTNIRERMSTVIKVPEENIYAKIKDASFAFSMHHILKEFESGASRKVNWKELNPEQTLGGYLFHVICLSGITNLNMLYRIAILSSRRAEMDDPYCGFLLSKDKRNPIKIYEKNHKATQNQNDDLIFRWIPDPISKKIYELHRTQWQSLTIELGSLEHLVMQFVDYLKEHSSNDSSVNQIKNLKQLFELSKRYQRTTLPSYVWHYLEGSFNTKDLAPQSLERLHGIQYQWEHSTHSNVERGLQLEDASKEQALFTWASKIIAAITSKPESRTKLKIEWLSKKYSAQEPLILVLKHWLLWKIDQKLSLHVIAKEAKLFLPTLLTEYELSEDFTQSDSEERIEELEELLCDLPRSKHAVFKRAWHSFHTFLIETGQIDQDQYKNPGQSKGSTNAQYFSIPEYEYIRALLTSPDHITKNEIDVNLKNKLLLVFTLAYRLGLRRSEVLKLATTHITMRNGELDLLCVRWWKERRLKTKSSERSIPIQGLLTDREYRELKLFVLHRRSDSWPGYPLDHLTDQELDSEIAQFATVSSLAISKPIHTNPFLLLDDAGDIERECEQIIAKIRSAMNIAITNKKPKFHQLRHACATNFLLLLSTGKLKHAQPLISDLYFGGSERLLKAAQSTIPAFKLSYADDQARYFAQRSRDTREALLSDYQHPYAEIYATSRVLGHSSPKTTLGSYIHVVPLLTGAYLYERCMDYSEKLQRALFPGNRRTFSRYASIVDKNKPILKKTRSGKPAKC